MGSCIIIRMIKIKLHGEIAILVGVLESRKSEVVLCVARVIDKQPSR